MPIDKCIYTYREMANNVLPGHFARLEESLKRPLLAETFTKSKTASKALLSEVNRTRDFSGCYAFLDGDKPIYVGISRTVVKRIVQHVNSDTHFSASLVYRMAFADFTHEMKREQAMKDEQFRSIFFLAQSRLRQMKVAFIQIDNDLELYLFEVYAAMSLDTSTWNTFRTH